MSLRDNYQRDADILADLFKNLTPGHVVTQEEYLPLCMACLQRLETVNQLIEILEDEMADAKEAGQDQLFTEDHLELPF